MFSSLRGRRDNHYSNWACRVQTTRAWLVGQVLGRRKPQLIRTGVVLRSLVQTRTGNLRYLKPTPLPIGLLGHKESPAIETEQLPDPTWSTFPVAPVGIEPTSQVLQTCANPSQLESQRVFGLVAATSAMHRIPVEDEGFEPPGLSAGLQPVPALQLWRSSGVNGG